MADKLSRASRMVGAATAGVIVGLAFVVVLGDADIASGRIREALEEIE